MVSTLLTKQPHNQICLLTRSTRDTAPGYVRLAEGYLEERLREPVSIDDVALACGVSRRSLFAAFKKHRGVGPMQWLRERRLDAAHKALRSGTAQTTVAAVGVEFGFSHFGEFSAAYARRFHELPSVTLRRRN